MSKVIYKKAVIASFLERFKRATLGKSFLWILSILETICFSLFFAEAAYGPFVEHFKKTASGKSSGTIYLNIAFLPIFCWWNVM